MKNLFFSILLSNISMMAFGQSILLTPQLIDSKQNSLSKNITLGGTNDPNILGLRYNGTLTSPTNTLSNDVLLSLEGGGYTTPTGFSGSQAAIIFSASQNWANSVKGTKLTFYTTNNDEGIQSNKMIIDHNGNVGIGTNTPLAKLQVDGDFALNRTTTISGNIFANSLNRNGASVINITSGTLTIGGIAGGVEGMVLYIFKDDAVLLDILNDYVGAPVGDRIFTSTGATFHSNAGTRIGGIALIYVGNYWRIVNQ